MSVVVDLSVPLRPGAEVEARLHERLPVYLGHECHAYDLLIRSHAGTYFETAAHVLRGAPDTDGVPLEDLVRPAVCVDVRPSQGREISAADLASARPAPRKGEALLVHTGSPSPPPGEHVYFSRDAAAWMADAGVVLFGSDTPRYDSGFESPTGFFVELFGRGIPIVANLRRLGEIAGRHFRLLVMPIRVPGVCTVPARVAALLEDDPAP